MFKFGNNKNNPNKIITAPLNCPKADEFLVKKDPNEVASAPNEMNTKEKPKTNCSELHIFLDLLFFSREKDAKKPGTIGRTQGEKKDNTPNPNEIKILSSIYQFKQM